jgi:ketosteroid isomerase-like protein
MSNVQLVQDLYEAVGRGDLQQFLAAFDPNIAWREAESNPYEPGGNPWFGGEAITHNLLAKLGSEWDGFTVTPTAFYDAGDTITVEGRYTGTFKATGKKIDAQFCHVWKLAGGKLNSFQQYTDTAQWQDAMGAR